jgi:hypothetical protein
MNHWLLANHQIGKAFAFLHRLPIQFTAKSFGYSYIIWGKQSTNSQAAFGASRWHGIYPPFGFIGSDLFEKFGENWSNVTF